MAEEVILLRLRNRQGFDAIRVASSLDVAQEIMGAEMDVIELTSSKVYHNLEEYLRGRRGLHEERDRHS